MNNGARFETYTIAGERGSGVICLNGAAARMVQTLSLIHICAEAVMTSYNEINGIPAIVNDEVRHVLKRCV